jgi:hypothetical protein
MVAVTAFRILANGSGALRAHRCGPATTTGRWRDKRAQRAPRSGGCFCWVFWSALHRAAILRNVRQQPIFLNSRCLLHVAGNAMADEREFRIRPGRIRSTRAQQARPFIAQALAAAQKAGGRVSRSGKITPGSRSRFGRGQRASIQANRLLTGRSRIAVIKARVVRHTGRSAPLGPARRAPQLSAPGRRDPRWGEGPAVQAGERRDGRAGLRGALRERPASFPLHRLAGGRRRHGRPQGSRLAS